MENKKRNGLILILLFVILIFIVFYLLIKMNVITINLDNLFKNNNKNLEQEVIDNNDSNSEQENSDDTEQEHTDNTIEEIQNRKYILYICFNPKYGASTIYKEASNCSEILGTIKTETENAKVLDYYRYYKQNGGIENIVALVDDNGLKIYDTENNAKKVNLENNYSKYMLIPMEANVSNDILGIEYYNDYDNRMFYNIKKDIKFSLNFPTEYVNENELSDYSLFKATAEGDYIVTTKYIGQGGSTNILISALDGKIVSFNNAYKFSNKYFFTSYSAVYSNDFKEIVTAGLWTIASDGYLYYNNKKDNKLLKYDIDGNLISTIKDYENIKLLTDDYIVYINNGKELIAKNIITKEMTKIKDMKDGDTFYDKFGVSTYRKNLINIESVETGEYREDGLYLVIENNYNWTEYYYNPITKVVKERYLGEDKINGAPCYNYEFNPCHD